MLEVPLTMQFMTIPKGWCWRKEKEKGIQVFVVYWYVMFVTASTPCQRGHKDIIQGKNTNCRHFEDMFKDIYAHNTYH